ncbi:thioredoxin fold domain-containing protein [Roseospira marina]|uniref:Thioredoxin fold domain-containing protein n=1 Tax=Roseospira marina TaxID=140057 RepID=A0A5M6IGF0_9PROT|nr:thioredoxin family protein [Roseospira marina]KAA5606658.1 thioredoxin fold domain-containing protein [Roseospira marina]MBB4313933.1 thioredoxin-related protein [Roseospira marina]MBB5087095.1 thioredoxin-related protein [Roseospira marina]
MQSFSDRRLTGLVRAIAAGALALGLLAALVTGPLTPFAPSAHASDTALIEPTLGEDGLYHHDFFLQSFLDISEDLADSHAQGKRLVVVFEQRGCIYCKKVNTEVLADPAINAYVREHFNVLQLNLFGERHVTDLDGEEMPEKQLARRWGVLFTPTFIFLPEDPADAAGQTGKEAAVFHMHGAFGKGTFTSAFEWVKQKGYATDRHFQQFVADRMAARQAAESEAASQ